MKKLLSMLFAIALIAGCDKGGDETSSITGYDSNKLKQTLYADQTGSGSGFTFTAAESWTTQVRDVTRASANEQPWVTLNPAQGGAGTFTLTITLDPNYTGADRKSEIRIVCGGTTITITVEQKGTTAEGEEPEPDVPTTAKMIKRVDIYTDGTADRYATFEYDNQGRTTLFCTYGEDNSLEFKETMTYTADKIKVEIFSKDGNYSNTLICEYTLDANGRCIYVEETIDGEKMKVYYTYDTNGYLTDYYTGSWTESSSVVPSAVARMSRANTDLSPQMNHAVWENGNMKIQYDDWQNGTYQEKTEYEYTTHKNGFSTIDLTMGATASELLILKAGTFGKIRSNLIAKETVTSKYPDNAGVYNWSYKFDNTGFYVTEFTRAFTATDPKASYTEVNKITYK